MANQSSNTKRQKPFTLFASGVMIVYLYLAVSPFGIEWKTAELVCCLCLFRPEKKI
jgi:hypothetical protein